MVQIIDVENAVGKPLAHDITEVRPGEFKGPAFRRGHVVKDSDIGYLRQLGKDHLFTVQPELDQLHEEDAARIIADALCGDGVGWMDAPREGKIALRAMRDGLLKVDVEALTSLNELEEVMCVTMHTNSVVSKGKKVAAARTIPLLIDKAIVEEALRIAKRNKPILRVVPFRQAAVGAIITGNEVYYGRIEDKFEPIIRKKVEALNGSVLDVVFLPDDDERIAAAAHDLIDRGADILMTTGGMSVDPDDRTRSALSKAGAKNMIGAMFIVASLRGVPVLGIPSCGLFGAPTVFDLIYPRVLAGDRITRKDMAAIGHGGLCLKCDPCRFPLCPFGKGH